jgi:cytochrome c
MKAIRAKTNGLEIEFTEPLKAGAGVDPSDYTVRQWRYVPSAAFSGPKQDDLILAVNSVTISSDRTRAFLELLDMAEGHVLHVHVSPFVRSAEDRPLWSTEGWYTLNQLPKHAIVKPAPAKPAPVSGLTEEEKQAGFEALFDGKNTNRWRGWRKTKLPSGWSVEKGELRFTPGSGEGGDICTVDEFDDFELRLEWRIAFGGNSGIFYRASETYEKPWESGPEMQVLDNDRHADGTKPETSAGSCYAMFAPGPHLLQRVGEFNEVRIVAKGERITHFLNGWMVVEYDLWTPEWQQRKDATLFSEIPNYGMVRKGRLVLQDHGNEVAFRNIRIKKLQ